MATVSLRRVVLNIDCEGPTVSNDNAYEAAEKFLADGKELFEQLSRFDDYTAYVLRRPQYNSGDTLRLLLPFLKAAGVTDRAFARFTKEKGIGWIEGAREAVAFAHDNDVPTFEISASYRPFTVEVARKLDIPRENIYCTDFGLDRFDMSASEAEELSAIAAQIKALPLFPEVYVHSSAADFSLQQLQAFKTCERLVWTEMLALPCSGRMLRQVRAMGGSEKVAAVFDAIRRSSVPPEDALYIGDSITDVEAFRALRAAGGVTIAFNGNVHAVEEAEYVAWGESSLVNALLLAVFATEGRDGLTRFVTSPDRNTAATNPIVGRLLKKLKTKEWGCAILNKEGRGEALEQSKRFRKLTRDHATASLS